ncbi:hypothetical protein J7E73_32265 [Paenibacillus albidus]|uniref:tubby C-terminal domain-like protein n=1 Tax=Paenibacillus albidus TaxID=2041023 RepID=UPI001BE9C247|nr:hypothetical protein [Paenibacillus albidus]MBT2293687.1 hypothetical protein [Paenibacillus albidus]
MKSYSYNPPKLKPSTKRIEVTDEEGNVACTFQRVYPNSVVKVCNYMFDIDWSAQVNVYSTDGHLVFQCKKTAPWLGRPEYIVQRCNTKDFFRVTYTTWQTLAPEFKITYQNQEYILKKDMLDWAKFLQGEEELARWKMKPTEWFKTRLEIEAACPIQEPEFFVALFQCIFYIGN